MDQNFINDNDTALNKAMSDKKEELHAQHEELTSAVEQLLSKNKILEKTLFKLERLNEEIDQIIHRTSHDLLGPIASMEGLFELICTDPQNSASYTEMVNKTSSEMRRRLENLVLFSRNLVNERKIERLEHDIFFNALEHELEKIEGYDEVEIAKSNLLNGEYYNDLSRLKLAIHSLIQNAIDYRSEKHKPKIKCFLFSNDKELRVTIQDNGIGIPESLHQSVFDMFFRGHNRSKGSGLGLYLCKRVVEEMEGTINLQSKEGVGTTITLNIPNLKQVA